MMLLYKQIAQTLQEKIHRGDFLSGEKLPSVREIGREHEVSLTTAQLAYRELEKMQLIYAVPKSGYFVIPNKTEALLPKAVNYIQKPVHIAQWNPTIDFLRVEERDNITSLSCAVPNIDNKTLEPLWQEMNMLSRRKNRLMLEYDCLQGLPALREQIHHISDHKTLFTPDDIVTTTSGHQALSLSIQASTQGDDVIAVESPTFPGLLQTLYGLGRRIIEIPTDPQTGIKLERVQEAFHRWSVKAIVVTPTCNNPMGCSMPETHKQQLLQLATQYGVTIIENDILAGLAYEYPRPSTIQSLDSDGHYFPHLRAMRQHYSELQCQYRELVESHFPPMTRISRPQGGFSLWVEHPPVDNRKLMDVLQRNKVIVLTGEHFSSDGCFTHHLRINYALPLIPRRLNGIKILGETLKLTRL